VLNNIDFVISTVKLI